jgi:hypothetical protein
MKRGFLATATALALVAGLGAASAQTGDKEQRGGADAPAAKQEKPKGKAGAGAESRGGAQTQEERKGQRAGKPDSDSPKTGAREGTQRKQQTQRDGDGKDQNQAGQRGDQARDRDRGDRDQARDRGDRRGSASLSSEQRTRIRDLAVQRKRDLRRITKVNFSIHVGSRVPRTVVFYPLPTYIIEIMPDYRDYLYVVVGDELLIIDPVTYEIVAVILV